MRDVWVTEILQQHLWRVLPAGKEGQNGAHGEDIGKDWLVPELLFLPLPLKMLSRKYFYTVLGHTGSFLPQGIIVSVE